MSQLKVDLGLVQKYNVAGPRYTSYPPATRFTDRITWSKLAPGRLAVFSYAHVPWIKPAQKILEQAVLPSAETKLQILKLIIEKLTANDRYVYIGMDHFARPDDELAVARRSGYLFVRNVLDLPNPQCLLAKPEGSEDLLHRFAKAEKCR